VAYIGNPIYQSAFVVDQFTGNGTTVAFTMSVAPAGVTNVLVAVSGVLQDPSTYGVVGNTITFSAAPPSGTGNISCRYLGVPASGVTTTAYRTVTEFTATASQTTFTPPSYTVGFINVYLNGVLLGSADYTATNGTTVVLTTGALAGNLVTVESFLVSSVLNAIPNTAGSVSSANIANDVTINFADGSASTPSITNNGDTNTGIFFPAADTIAFTEGGVESMRINSASQVLVGTTTTPSSSAQGIVNVNSGGGFIQLGFNNSNGGGSIGAVSGGGLGFYGYTGAVGSETYSERMRITSAGDVGIGTSSPAFRLDVRDGSGATRTQITNTANAAPGAGVFFQVLNSGTQVSNSTIAINNTGDLRFFTGTSSDAERMRITSSGALCVGTTSATGSVRFIVESDTTTLNPMTVSNTRSTAATDYSILFYRNGSIVGSVQTSLSATSYVTSSDYRLKENIAPMTGALAKVELLKPVTYDWKTGGSSQGFIAHELAEVCPDAVTGEKDAVDEDGNIKPQGIDTSFLVATLTAAIQELKATVDAQALEIAALKDK
jgi:hypothetical protein